jgi:hypothetical protein
MTYCFNPYLGFQYAADEFPEGEATTIKFMVGSWKNTRQQTQIFSPV